MGMMTYTAVGFDYNGVINGLSGFVFRGAFCGLVGIDDERFGQVYFAHNKKVNRGEVSWEEFWTLVLADLDKPERLAEVLHLQSDPRWSNINADMLSLVDSLRASGYKTGLLSNTTNHEAAEMRRQSIDKHFDVFHISAETGSVKPEPEAFKGLAQALGVNVQEMVFIDDVEKSLSTAKEVGFEPLLFRSYQELQNQLQNLGIL
jgi:HAD superfamily hydrolase (TIGR01509 family)